MKKLLLLINLLCLAAIAGAISPQSSTTSAVTLPCFVRSPYFGEQELTYVYNPGIKIRINAPAASEFDRTKPTRLIFYALPNGNSTDWTVGKLPAAGDDWHFQIQHIGAQTRFVREKDHEHNIVTVYVEADSKSWGKWVATAPDRKLIIKKLINDIYTMFADYNPSVELNSHSGGGNFIFGYIDAVEEIPSIVKRISFIDSNYGWDNDRYGRKLIAWIKSADENCLFVACYDDARARLNGKPFVSRKGGTWYKTQKMQQYLKKNLKGERWTKAETDSSKCFIAKNGRIQLYSKKNPERKIYHTVLVERNGFIHSAFAGTGYENSGYTFMGERQYDRYRQDSILMPHALPIPPRRPDAMTGSEFVRLTIDSRSVDRDSTLYREIIAGNIPESMRQPILISERLEDANGTLHDVTFAVLPDFLAIGCDSDFFRVPLLPHTAQRIADHFGAVLPTCKISHLIHSHSEVKLEPHPMTPDATMTTMPVFARHDSIIEASRIENGMPLNALIAGHKKDIVITNRIADEPDRLFIYGWHHPDGKAIQQLTGVHKDYYVDYSHGTRLVSDEVLIDGKPYSLKQVLTHPTLYRLFSDEAGPMKVTGYQFPESE